MKLTEYIKNKILLLQELYDNFCKYLNIIQKLQNLVDKQNMDSPKCDKIY